MNFGLLGDNAAALGMIEAIAADPAHSLTHAAGAGALSERLIPLVPGVRILGQWQDLLEPPEVDAVLVAGAVEHLREGIRQLAAAGKPLIVFPEPELDLSFVYELSLIRDDSGTTLLPVLAARLSPQLQQLQTQVQSGALGRLLHLQMEHLQRPADSAAAGLLSWSNVDRVIVRDVELLRSIGGNYERVTAVPSGTVEGRFARLTVTLAGDDLPEAVWTLKPAENEENWAMTLTGENGEVTVSGSGDSPRVTVATRGVTLPGFGDTESGSEIGANVLARFEAALTGDDSQSDWADLTRALEIADAARRSVRRKRTIELHFETQSERSQFKSQMTAIGCGVLMLTFFGVLVVLMIGALFDPETISPAARTAWKIIRIAVFLPLLLFLLFQGLLFITRPSSDAGR